MVTMVESQSISPESAPTILKYHIQKDPSWGGGGGMNVKEELWFVPMFYEVVDLHIGAAAARIEDDPASLRPDVHL